MAQVPGKGHPDRWIYEDLFAVRKALYALIAFAQGFDLDSKAERLLREAADTLK